MVDFEKMTEAEIQSLLALGSKELTKRRSIAEEKAWKNLVDAMREYLTFNPISFHDIINYGDCVEIYGMSDVDTMTVGSIHFKDQCDY